MSRVLVVTGGPGPDHAHDFTDPVTGTGPALVRLLTAAGHEVELTDDVDAGFCSLADGPVDVVVVNALRWRMEAEQYARWRDRWALSLSGAARRTITAFVADGGGLVGNHTASICFDDWPGWGEMLGGAWAWGRSSHPPQAPVTVEIVDADHPVTSGLPPRWDLVDEVYGDLDLQPDLDVLAVARRHPTDHPQPVVWARSFGAGRVVYDAFGHDVASLANHVHGRLVRQAVAWAARSAAPVEQEVRA